MTIRRIRKTLPAMLLLLALLLQIPAAAWADAGRTPARITVAKEGTEYHLPVIEVNGTVYAEAATLVSMAGCDWKENANSGLFSFFRSNPFVLLYQCPANDLPVVDGQRYVPLQESSRAIGLRFTPYQTRAGFYVTALKTPADFHRTLDDIFQRKNYHLWEVPAELGLGWNFARDVSRVWASLPFVGNGSFVGMISGKDEQDRYDRALASVLNAHSLSMQLLYGSADLEKTIRDAGKFFVASRQSVQAAQKKLENSQELRAKLEDSGFYDLVHDALDWGCNPYEEGLDTLISDKFPDASNTINIGYWLDTVAYISAVADGEAALVRALGTVCMNSRNVYLSMAATRMLDQKFHGAVLTSADALGGYVYGVVVDQMDDRLEDILYGNMAPAAFVGGMAIKTVTEWVFASPDIGDISDAVLYYTIYNEIAMALSDAYYARRDQAGSSEDLRSLALMYLSTSKAAVEKCRFDQSLSSATDNMDRLIAEDTAALLAFGDEEYDPQYDNAAFVRYAESEIAAQAAAASQATPAPQRPTASAADREDALRAYAQVLDSGVELRMGWGNPFPARSYYLFDMDGDGIEELLVYGSVDDQQFEWAFRVLTYRDGAVWEIADSLNTCDFSEWSNVSSKIAVLDGRELYAYVWKSTIGINSGSISAISYDGTYTGVRDGSQIDTANLYYIVDNDRDYGIRIHSPADFLQGYLTAPTPAPTPVPPTPTPAVITPTPIPSGVVPPHETMDKPKYYGHLWRVEPYDAGWVCEISLETWEYYDDSYVRSLSVGDYVTFGGDRYQVLSIQSGYLELESGLTLLERQDTPGIWQMSDLSGGVATYPIGTARLLVPFGTPIMQNANMENMSLSDPQELIDLNGEGVSVYLEYANDYITYLESDYHP